METIYRELRVLESFSTCCTIIATNSSHPRLAAAVRKIAAVSRARKHRHGQTYELTKKVSG